jgi:transcriptional repressor NrdR
MRCPYCGYLDSKVVDTRESTDLSATRRRRECLSCGKRFSTYEHIETTDLMVVKKDDRREPFNADKLRAGLVKALEKRPVGMEQINSTVEEIEQELRQDYPSEVPSKAIGALVMKKLKKLDQVAYIRFASVYKNFTEVRDFEEAAKEFITKRK